MFQAESQSQAQTEGEHNEDNGGCDGHQGCFPDVLCCCGSSLLMVRHGDIFEISVGLHVELQQPVQEACE